MQIFTELGEDYGSNKVGGKGNFWLAQNPSEMQQNLGDLWL